MPDHGRHLQRAAFALRQRIQPCLQHAGQRGRHLQGAELVAEHAPALAVGQDYAVVDEHLHQFFHVERVALGAGGEHRAQAFGHIGEALQQ